MATIARPELVRRDSKLSESEEIYDAVVVGAGPAGITAVGNLLENGVNKILWVDEAFNGGRVNEYYREVPSNTKVKLFIDFATAVSPFRKVVGDLPSQGQTGKFGASGDAIAASSVNDKLQDLRKLDQEKGCRLSHAADMCLMLTNGLKHNPGITTQQGRVSEALLDDQTGSWTVHIDGEHEQSVQAKRLVLCTGSSPLDPPLSFEPNGLQHIDLDVALSPTRLADLLASQDQTTVAVIGASHSAVLVLMNLTHLATTTRPDLKIKWFTRHPLRYAEYEEGFIARDNTGLKGEAAVWAKENLEPETLPTSAISKHMTKIAYEKGQEKQVYEEHMPGCSYVIQAIGYARNQIPTLRLASTGKEVEPQFDHDRGLFSYTREDGGKQRLPGIYGAGIAFPQRVVDKKYGHEEFNVGFFKFMKAVKGWAPEWKAVA